MPERFTLTEATAALGDIQQGPASKGRFRALLIKAGWGSSGYYSEEVLKRDGPKIWPAGTQGYLDHPSLSETVERPERSVRDLASATTTDPVWDPALGGLVAEVEVFPQWRDLLNEEFAKKVGLSIRAYGVAEVGEVEGRTGSIVTELTEGISVDWVTRAGAGGRVLELIESARRRTEVREGRNVGGWFESRIHSSFTMQADDMYGQGRLSREERIALSSAIGDGLDAFTKRVEADQPQLYQRDIYAEPDGDATLSEARRQVLREGHGMTARDLGSALGDAVRTVYGDEDMWTWVRDHTDDWVVFSVEDGTDCDLHQQTYTVDEGTGAVTLTGEPVEVRARTTYVPAPPTPDEPQDPSPGPTDEPVTENAPGNPPADPTQIKEGSMPELTDEQARQLEEAATTRTQLDEATTRLSEATTALEQTTSRVTDLETRLAESDTRAQRLENDRTARARVTEALATSGLPEISHTKVAESVCRTLPTVEGGGLDDTALTESITKVIDAEKTYVAALAEASGAGAPRGLGAAPEPLSEADIDAQLEKEFTEMGLSASAAKTAASGR